ncbi:MAG TPA: CmpA/NrtA family ABC transporter substrate-binding protein [Chloroflexota bacterium]|nr:CmpA/NrtA family ABC transporter substrate-binding protein [Chloroflexota bacterium]
MRESPEPAGGTRVRRRTFLRGLAGAGASLFAASLACGTPTGGASRGGTTSPPREAASQPTVATTVVAGIEKPQLTIGFIPITCATPIIMAHPLGFYRKYGLDVTVRKYGGWADIRDAFIAGEIDASHLLSPMPISLSLGLGSAKVPTRLAAIENINGQAITLAAKYKDRVQAPADFKGMVLAVPFDYSVHNLLLRAYLAEGGLDPDRDVQIRVMRPPDMVANLAAGNIDGYLAPDPFNQRAVYEGVGYIHLLSKELWDSHPCCAFAVRAEFIERYPNTYRALLHAIVDATHYSSQLAHREEVAVAIAARDYLNQPEEVVKAVLTGKYQDGRGRTLDDPRRIDFDPYPWKSFAVWMQVQFARWGYLRPEHLGGLTYQQVADQVFLTPDVRVAQAALGLPQPEGEYKVETILGKPFDAQSVRT